MKPQRSCCVCQQSSSPSIHAAICSVTSWMAHPTSCSAARPAPRHLRKSAIPEGLLKSKAEFQLHIKGEASVFKQSTPEAAAGKQKGLHSAFIHCVLLTWAAHSQHGGFPQCWVPTSALPEIPGTCRLWEPPQASCHLHRWDSPRGNSHPLCKGSFMPRRAQQTL